MKKLYFAINLTACILLLSAAGYSQTAHPSKSSRSVIKTIQELCKAFESADTERLRQNMTADFTLTSSNGTVTSLEDEINDLKSGKARYRVFEDVDMKPRIYGNTAVVTGRTIIKGEYDKTPIDMDFNLRTRSSGKRASGGWCPATHPA